MNKTFPVELGEELHKRLKHAAIDEGVTLHDWIVNTLEQRIGLERENGNNARKRNQRDDPRRRAH